MLRGLVCYPGDKVDGAILAMIVSYIHFSVKALVMPVVKLLV